jgi:hypothetical protein
VLTSRIRAVILGLLAVMMTGSLMAATASAAAGPFWHHRALAGKGEGEKIESKAPENFKGEGGVQTLLGKISTTEIEITSKSLQVKGAIFNNELQGQAKLELVYNQPTLIKPVLKGCVVTVGEKNIVITHGHLAWKWNGEAKQLEEATQKAQTPDLIFTPAEIVSGAKELPKGEFTKITLSGTGCGVLAGSFKVEGSEEGIPTPKNVEEWSTTLLIGTPAGETTQHFWNGTAFIGVRTGLLFGGNAASLIGQTTVTAGQQEVAVFEK